MRDHRDGVLENVTDISRRVREYAFGHNVRWRVPRTSPEDHAKPVQTRIGKGRRGGKAGKILRSQR